MEWIAVVVVALAVLAAAAYVPIRRVLQDIEFERARELFVLQRERLEAKFCDLAAASGKPKGLRWEQCDFHSPVSYARDRSTRNLSAFVEVSIRFAAIEGGGMEDVEAVHNLRHATAVFHYHRGQWGTGGRVLFNMNPSEAIHHFQSQYVAIPLAP